MNTKDLNQLRLIAAEAMLKLWENNATTQLELLQAQVGRSLECFQEAKPLLKDMDEPTLSEHLNEQLRFIKSRQTPDTIGSMLVIFGDNGITQYGATVDPETAPQALRELADRIEKRETVKRGY